MNLCVVGQRCYVLTNKIQTFRAGTRPAPDSLSFRIRLLDQNGCPGNSKAERTLIVSDSQRESDYFVQKFSTSL